MDGFTKVCKFSFAKQRVGCNYKPSIMTLKTLTFALFIFFCSLTTYGQTNNEIKAALKKFQEGYSKRDTTLASKFADDLCTKDIQIIGTGEDEWFQGIASAKNLFKNDWAYWLTLIIDTTNINLTTLGNTAFFTAHGTASITFPNKDIAYDYAIGRLQQLVNNEKTSHSKLLTYSSQASNLIQQIEGGSLEIKYSIRLSGGLVKQNDKWLFKQLVFSFPYPMTRK